MVDLYSLLRYTQNNEIKEQQGNVVLYGVLGDIIEDKPACVSFAADYVQEECFFVKFELFAFKSPLAHTLCRGMGCQERDGMYECEPLNMIVYVTSTDYYSNKGACFVKIIGRKVCLKDNVIMLQKLTPINGDKAKWRLVPAQVLFADDKDFTDGTDVKRSFIRSRGIQKIEHSLPTQGIADYTGDSNLAISMPAFTPSRSVPQIQNFNKSKDIAIKGHTGVYPIKNTDFEAKIADCRKKFDMLMTSFDPVNKGDFYLEDFLEKLSKDIDGRAGECLEEYILSKCPKADAKVNGTAIYKTICNNFSALRKGIPNSDFYSFDSNVASVCRTCFIPKEKFYVEMLWSYLGWDKRYAEFLANVPNIISIINENPYLLRFRGISLKQCQVLAMILGVAEDAEWVGLAYVDSLICEDGSDGSTFADIGTLGIGKSYSPISTDSYVEQLYTIGRTGYIEAAPNDTLMNYISKYIEKGLGVEVDGYISPFRLANREWYIYTTLNKRGSVKTDIPENMINTLLNNFEAQRGFKLEPEQRQACISLLTYKCGCLTGCAGSGKTTTIEALIYVLSNVSNYMKMPINLAATTGKAASRMFEVLKKPAKTIHSLFKLGVGWGNSGKKLSGIFFLDEFSMTTVPLMYNVLRNITDDSLIYFVGDINQLPPIGSGLPFRDAMLNITTAVLGASKRTQASSKITENATKLLNSTDALTDGADFHIAKCSNDFIQQGLDSLTRFLLGTQTDQDELNLDVLGIYPDVHLKGIRANSPKDIQVVTPVTKENYTWGAVALNRLLQKSLNPNKSGWFRGDTLFQADDRVMHVDENTYSLVHFSEIKDKTAIADGELGVCNGEVGYIEGIVSGLSFDYSALDEDEYKSSHYRSDVSWNNTFLKVKYWDAMNQRDYFVLYRCKKLGGNISGGDLNKLALNYASTVHKSQGSQYDIVIFVLGSGLNVPNFITKNMIYTGLTRASKACILLGDVSADFNSAITRGRSISATANVTTLANVLGLGCDE